MSLSFPYDLFPKCLSYQEIKVEGEENPIGEKGIYRLSDGLIMIQTSSHRFLNKTYSHSEITRQQFYTMDELRDESFGRRNFGKEYYKKIRKWIGIEE